MIDWIKDRLGIYSAWEVKKFHALRERIAKDNIPDMTYFVPPRFMGWLNRQNAKWGEQ